MFFKDGGDQAKKWTDANNKEKEAHEDEPGSKKKPVMFSFNDVCVVKMRKVAFLVVDLLFKKV